jgi:hypothetical protein
MPRSFAPSRLAAAVCTALMLSAAPALATHVGEELTVDVQAVSANDQLMVALKQWRNAPPAVQQSRMQQLVQLAQARQERLVRLLERNPGLAALRVLPQGLRAEFPAAARAYLEEDLRGDGSVVARVADDFDRGRSSKQFLFHPSAAGASALVLAIADASERDLLALAGKRVRLNQGLRIGTRLLVGRKADLVALDAGGASPDATGTVVSTTPKVQGTQKTLVILANFTDKALACSAADVNTRVFATSGSSVNTSFRESSRNLVSFNGQVVGPFTINYSSAGSCDFQGWGSAADAAARAAGVDPSQYQRVNYVTPSNSTCGWSGLAYMPGRTSWVQSCGSTGVYTHELGHNLSLHHAGSPTAEYGDASDPMGGARNVRNNAANQVMAGWVPTGGLIDVAAGGSYSVQALGGEAGTQPQVLRLRKTDSNEYYYVSMRQALGLDAALSASALNTVAVHRASGTLPAKTTLLAQLAIGQSYSDTPNGITLTNQGVAGNVATVGVVIGGASCTRNAPGVTVSPASQSGAPGTTRSYTASVVNNNTAACGSSAFALTQALPAAFAGSLSASSLSVGAGASASATWSVTPGATAADGSATLDLSAAESGGTSTTAHAAYIVMRDAGAPVIASVSPASGSVLSGRTATLSASVSDDVGVTKVEFWGNGKLLASDTSAPYSTSWNVRKQPKGTATIVVRAFDAAGNVSQATSTVTIQ